MVKALARAFRWRKMLDTGVHATLEDLARAKGVHATYVSRVLRLTQLAPEIVVAILDGRRPEGMRLEELLGVSDGVGRATHVPTCAVVSDGAAYTQSDVPEDSASSTAPAAQRKIERLLLERSGTGLQPSDLPILQGVGGENCLPRAIRIVVH